MRKFWKPIPLLIAAVTILACSLFSTPGPSATSVATIVPSDTPLPAPLDTPAAETTDTTAPQGILVSFANVSLTIPNGLASGATSEAVPPVSDQAGNAAPPGAVAPAYTRFTLQGYLLQDRRFESQINVYPAQEYAAVSAGAAISLQRLQAILANPSAPLTNDVLPRIPFVPAEQIFASQTSILQFQNGSGVRVVTQYAQAVVPINNYDLLYHFEGLTADGKYYVVATLPVNVPFLAASYDPSAPLPPDGIPVPDLTTAQAADFDAYFQAVSDKLNATPADSFNPSLALLDSLIASIQISP